MTQRGWRSFTDGINEQWRTTAGGISNETLPQWEPDPCRPGPPPGWQPRADQTPIPPGRAVGSAWSWTGFSGRG